MNLDQRETLVNEMRIGEISHNLVDRDLRFLAMRALKIRKLNDLKILAGCALGGAVGTLDQSGAILDVGVLAEGQNFASRDDVLAIWQVEELQSSGLGLSLFANQYHHVGDPGDGGLRNALDLVDAIRVKSPL